MGINTSIPIVYITDNNYTMPVMVSVLSLYKNMENPPYVYILGIDLSDENKELLKKNKGWKIEVLNLENKYKNLDLTHHHVSKAALFKFDLAEIFKKFDKILYLDCDTLILKNIQSLLNIDIEGVYAGVIKDIFASLNNGDNKTIGVENYFNSGVMLLNLKKMREEAIGARLLDTRLNLKSEKYMDQDVFNIVFKDCVKYLSPDFNYMLNKDNTAFGFREFYQVKKISPAILHFAFLKPWEYKGVPYSKEWMKYYNLSSFRDKKLKLKENPEKFKIYKKRKFNDRWVVDIFGIRFSYKKGGKDFRVFYP